MSQKWSPEQVGLQRQVRGPSLCDRTLLSAVGLLRRWGEHALLAGGVAKDNVRQRRATLPFPEWLNWKAR